MKEKEWSYSEQEKEAIKDFKRSRVDRIRANWRLREQEKDAIAKMYQEKTLEDYEQMLFKQDNSMTFSPKSAYFSVYSWIKDNEPKLYYTKILQLIADDLHGGRHTHIYMDTSYHITNSYEVNVHCGHDEGCVYFRSNELAIKARDILGSKIEYLFNQA